MAVAPHISASTSDAVRSVASRASGAGSPTPEAVEAAAKRQRIAPGGIAVAGGVRSPDTGAASPTPSLAAVREAFRAASTAGAQLHPGGGADARGAGGGAAASDARPGGVDGFPLAEPIAELLATPANLAALTEATGAVAEWTVGDRQVALAGSSEQIAAAKARLQRVVTHCQWGVHDEKVHRLLGQRAVETMLVRLSPLGSSLRPVEKALTVTSTLTLALGKDQSNDAVILDELISRQHCVLELDPSKGCVYVLDLSTNGTFLNGKRLPAWTTGKIVLSHGDTLSLKDPAQDGDLGFVVNLVDPSLPPPAVEDDDDAGAKGKRPS